MASLNPERFVNERPAGRLHRHVLLWIFLALIADGYNMTVAAFAAADIARTRGLDPAAPGPNPTASVIGMLFGKQLPLAALFAISIAPMVLGEICAAIITPVPYRPQGTFRLGEIAA
jgi:hypothetical protein